MTPERVGDIARSLLVLSALEAERKELKNCDAEECRKLAVYFATKVRTEVARDISKSVLSKSRLHKLHTFMEKTLGQKYI